MKYCTKCGNELVDEAVICTKCGCMIGSDIKNVPASEEKLDVHPNSEIKNDYGWIPLVFGILALVSAFSVFLETFDVGYAFSCILSCLGINSSILLSIISAIAVMKKNKNGSKTFPILGLIFGCIAAFVTFVSDVIYWLIW